MLRFLVAAVLILVFGAATSADTIVLKNGRRIDVEQAWEEDGVVKGDLYGSVVQYPRREVAHILTDALPVDYQQLRFGPWKLGMTQDQVFDRAYSDAIQLRPRAAGEAPGIPSDETLEEAGGLRYEAMLLGRRASVQLHFTPQTRTLWSIQAVWRGEININKSRLKNDIASHCRNEYGNPSSHLKHSWFAESIHWRVGNSGTIRLQTRKGTLELAYFDTFLEDLNRSETEAAAR